MTGRDRWERLLQVASLGAALASIAALLAVGADQISNASTAAVIAATIGLAATAIVGASSAWIATAARRLPHRSRVFISYRHRDVELARELAQLVNDAGGQPWLDTSLQPGEDLRAAIVDAIDDADLALFLVADDLSRWGEFEFTAAEARGVRIVPVVIASHEGLVLIPDLLSSRRWLVWDPSSPGQLREQLSAIL